MSDIAMLLEGVGLEAFDDAQAPTPALDLTVDLTPLTETSAVVDTALGEMEAERQRLVGLRDAYDYGQSMRETLSESAAADLQQRVIAVLGEERATTIVGSVESYNGPLAGSLLTCGLESISGFLRNAIAELIRLIRTGIRTMMQYFSSARVVLGKQLEANDLLRKALGSSDAPWQNWALEVKDVYRGVTIGSAKVTGPQLRALCTTDGSSLTVPEDFVGILKSTAHFILNSAIPGLSGLNDHYAAILQVVRKSPSMSEPSRFLHLAQLHIDRFVPANRLLASGPDKHGMCMLSTNQLMGAKVFNIRATPIVMHQRYGHDANALEVVKQMSQTTAGVNSVNLRNVRTQLSVRALSQPAGLASLDQVDYIANVFLKLDYADDMNTLAKVADRLAHEVLLQLDGDSRMDFCGRVTEIMSALTRVTASATRELIAYVNELCDAVRAYVSVSAGIR